MTFSDHLTKYIKIGNDINIVTDLLSEFTHNMINLDNINFEIIECNYITGWDIQFNDDYTENVFYTDRIQLNRILKLEKLLS